MEAPSPVRRPTDSPFDLFSFAWMPARTAGVPTSKHYESRLKDLADRAQPEVWSFDQAQPFAILGNYLRYTFKRLVQESKVEEGTDATEPSSGEATQPTDSETAPALSTGSDQDVGSGDDSTPVPDVAPNTGGSSPPSGGDAPVP